MPGPDIADHAALRVMLITLKNRTASIADEYEQRGEHDRARWMREDVAAAEAALQGASEHELYCRRMTEAHHVA